MSRYVPIVGDRVSRKVLGTTHFPRHGVDVRVDMTPVATSTEQSAEVGSGNCGVANQRGPCSDATVSREALRQDIPARCLTFSRVRRTCQFGRDDESRRRERVLYLGDLKEAKI